MSNRMLNFSRNRSWLHSVKNLQMWSLLGVNLPPRWAVTSWLLVHHHVRLKPCASCKYLIGDAFRNTLTNSRNQQVQSVQFDSHSTCSYFQGVKLPQQHTAPTKCQIHTDQFLWAAKVTQYTFSLIDYAKNQSHYYYCAKYCNFSY